MDALNAADWLIIVIIAVSTLISLLRGFIKEAMSLVSWILALVLALVFSDRLALLFESHVADPLGRYILAFAILFVSTLVLGALVARLVRTLIDMAGLSALDRALGMVFGAARGVLVLLAAAVMLRPTFELDTYDWWRQSALLPHLMLLEDWFRGVAEVIREAIVALWQ